MKSQSGFTLVEMVVGLAILSLLALAVGGLMHAGAITLRLAHERDDATDARLAAELTLSRELQRAYPFNLSGDPQAHRVAFTGEPDRVTFVTALPDWLGFGGFDVVRLETVPTGNGSRRLDLVWSSTGAGGLRAEPGGCSAADQPARCRRWAIDRLFRPYRSECAALLDGQLAQSGRAAAHGADRGQAQCSRTRLAAATCSPADRCAGHRAIVR